MDFKALRFHIFHGLARRVLLRAFMIALALSIIPLLQTLSRSDPRLFDSANVHECDVPFMLTGTNLFKNRIFKPIWESFGWKEDVNLTANVVREIMDMQMLDYGAKALYVGEGSASAVYALRELGFTKACGVYRNPFFSLKPKKLVYELQYADNSFDLVISRDLDKVSVPAILMFEIERVLKPGGTGAVLVGGTGSKPNSLIKSATPISSLLKSSNVVHVSHMNELTLVVFKKRIYTLGYFEQFQLPSDCPSVVNNRPFMEFLEPPAEKKQIGFEKNIAYLPKFLNIPSRKNLVYVDIGAGADLNCSAANWLSNSYPVDHKAFTVYVVDHNTSVLLSCIKKPGVTFIYHPGLAGDKATHKPDVEELDPSVEDEEFDLLGWFKETVQYADFVVLKMKAGENELKFLTDLFKSGTICIVDELFLNCSGHLADAKGLGEGDCMDLFKSLINTGVFVHQWWGD